MRFPGITRRATILMASSALLLGVPAAVASAAPAAATAGWIRLAHLSPNTPAVDVYLYSFGNKTKVVLHHVAYGDVSPYETVSPGSYSVAMRAAGASSTSQPVLSTSVNVKADHAYTVAGMGPKSGLRLQVLDDQLSTQPGKSAVRVVQASLKQQTVKVHCSCGGDLVSKASFGSVSSYAPIPPGNWTMSVIAPAGGTQEKVPLTSGDVTTLVVLDGAHGLQLDVLRDAAGAGSAPIGAVSTGFGGTAPHGPGSPLPWLGLIAAGCVLAAGGGLWLRRSAFRRLPHAGA
jgi:Domain of unknown function (DUF4397)